MIDIKLKRTRLTNAEKEAGLTVEEKKRGVTLEDKLKVKSSPTKRKTLREIGTEVIQKEKDKKREERQKKKEMQKNTDPARVLSMNRETKVDQPSNINKKEVIRILGTDGTEKTVHEIILEELGKAIWEWKELPIDKNFRLSELNKLGKEGWKFAFIFDPQTAKTASVFLQRPRR